jgi:hypothetical protein
MVWRICCGGKREWPFSTSQEAQEDKVGRVILTAHPKNFVRRAFLWGQGSSWAYSPSRCFSSLHPDVASFIDLKIQIGGIVGDGSMAPRDVSDVVTFHNVLMHAAMPSRAIVPTDVHLSDESSTSFS